MNFIIPLLFLSALANCAEIQLVDGRKIPYGEIIVTPEAPMSYVIIKNEDKTVTFKYSEVKNETLPPESQKLTKQYISDQLQKRLIIKDDKWMHRDEMLLNNDPRYSAKGKLAKVGKSIINFKNTTEQMVTLGVRSGDKGFEMHIEAGKKKGYQVPDGKVFYIMAQESRDGTQLIVQKSDLVDLNNVNLTVTIVTSDQIPPNELGTIDIPVEYQVK